MKFNQQKSVLFYLSFLTLFFLGLEISFFIQCNQKNLASVLVASNYLGFPLALIPSLLFFIIVQLLIHALYTILIWFISLNVASYLRVSNEKMFSLSIGVWFIGILTCLTANQYFFPHSNYAELTAMVLFHPYLTKIVFFALILVCSSLILLATLNVSRQYPRLCVGVFVVTGACYGLGFFSLSTTSTLAGSDARPNIILIGIDSLRPDFLSFFGSETPTPFLDSFLNKASVFSEAVTPIARTFPAWISILTGEYPNQNGIRTNLADQSSLNFSQSLPAILQRAGYETAYATDEARFSNIDTNMGFDHIISPPMGINDFLLGTLNDFPLSNLLVNTRVGLWLFPYSYGNRAVFFTYQPERFFDKMEALLATPRKRPLLLATHFCLTHFPYTWADAPHHETIQQRYRASVMRVDAQISHFFALLQKNHLLDNAIVVLLSDHGEGLEFPGDRVTEPSLYVAEHSKSVPHFYPPSVDQEEVNQTSGHGTDVLGLPQYHVVLAFRKMGTNNVPQPKILPGVVSLLDIKPTLLSWLEVQAARAAGVSLLPIIKGQHEAVKSRLIFMESDFSPEAVRSVFPDTHQVILEGVRLFQVNPRTLRLTVKNNMSNMIMASKQYAVISGNWMLALYPHQNGQYQPILVNLASGLWTDDLHFSLARQSPANHLLQALNTFKAKDIHNIAH